MPPALRSRFDEGPPESVAPSSPANSFDLEEIHEGGGIVAGFIRGFHFGLPSFVQSYSDRIDCDRVLLGSASLETALGAVPAGVDSFAVAAPPPTSNHARPEPPDGAQRVCPAA